MIRPSALTLAEKCGLAPHLAEQFPTDSDAAKHGRAIHAEIAACIEGTRQPDSDEAKAVLDFLAAYPSAERYPELKLTLSDPETGEPITRGTADLVLVERHDGLVEVTVIDWKTGAAIYVPAPDENLQLLAYGVAAAIELHATSLTLAVMARPGKDRQRFITSREMVQADLWPIIDRIKAIQDKETSASTGLHCSACYSRRRCYAWMLPAYQGEGALVPFSKAEPLTSEQYVRALQACDAMDAAVELVRNRIKADARSGIIIEAEGKVYAPSLVSGRKSVSVKDAEAAGQGHLVKTGDPYERWTWRKA